MDELEVDLRKYVVQARNGQHAGAGVLGRVAEFLVCQRGILRKMTPLLDEMVQQGLVVFSDVDVIKYTHNSAGEERRKESRA